MSPKSGVKGYLHDMIINPDWIRMVHLRDPPYDTDNDAALHGEPEISEGMIVFCLTTFGFYLILILPPKSKIF